MSESSKPKVFFFLGGPGSGKGTACDYLVKEFGFTHFSAGDLLREASKSNKSDVEKKIAEIIRMGNIVPSEITVELLSNAIAEHPNPRGYIIDGFPRKMDQALMFEEGIAPAKGIFYFDCHEETMEARVLHRAKEGSGRDDDDIEVLRRRFRTNVELCMPVVERYKAENRLHTIDANRSREEVYGDVKRVMLQLGEVPL
ncbi:putative adenylate kinase [Trypanosoma cruzi]|uniref:Adenylate kinase, putative n=3 Tax=Trypanosoma cruzi TaxID=5693 RepID=Q4DLV1_TRYCC|nr:adenylate kinase, putative [Trypanosoma cruzi]ESS65858.1 adenylate kinase [Trypanosoma cruzi Dm28c]PBJ69359.1 adenylate kinase [Trypanosoma cruzi cruzi]AAS20419.1 adenylate kinase 5 [Trypanosoma cruzi]EAN93509.1 adenylate kinase, putative [Trypanosoma cruzi]KAF8283927.1 putative UMP/CMP kinase [Trypanosoma cruzi]|eukprot:XP_815360.1 adenylate kinase [Trypanosoma cruzi strain CL Brener]